MRYHFCQSIRGALSNWQFPKDYRNVFIINGKSASPEEAREFLFNSLSEGKEVLPMNNCDNFDYQNGCKGHDDEPKGGANEE